MTECVVVLTQLWLGGTPNQTSLARVFMDKVKIHDLEKVLEPVFYHWKRKRQSKESFGDFANRLVSQKSSNYSVLLIVFSFSLSLK